MQAANTNYWWYIDLRNRSLAVQGLVDAEEKPLTLQI
jgi:hypothetical protein